MGRASLYFLHTGVRHFKDSSWFSMFAISMTTGGKEAYGAQHAMVHSSASSSHELTILWHSSAMQNSCCSQKHILAFVPTEAHQHIHSPAGTTWIKV